MPVGQPEKGCETQDASQGRYIQATAMTGQAYGSNALRLSSWRQLGVGNKSRFDLVMSQKPHKIKIIKRRDQKQNLTCAGFSCFLENWRHLCFGRLWGGMCRFAAFLDAGASVADLHLHVYALPDRRGYRGTLVRLLQAENKAERDAIVANLMSRKRKR